LKNSAENSQITFNVLIKDGVRQARKHSLKCGIAGSVNFRKCRIRARASQRAHKREVSSGAHVYGRVFEENSKLKALRYFSGAFNPSFPEIDLIRYPAGEIFLICNYTLSITDQIS